MRRFPAGLRRALSDRLLGGGLPLTGSAPRRPAPATSARVLLAALTVLAAACVPAGRGVVEPAPRRSVRPAAAPAPALTVQRGTASYYADRFAGRRTASGVRYDPNAMVAAHRTLPFGTIVRVTNLRNGRSVVVKIVDRGPFAGHDRIIDLSKRAARKLRFIGQGLAPVRLEVLKEPRPARSHGRSHRPATHGANDRGAFRHRMSGE